MNLNEVRAFKLDKARKPDCRLSMDEIEIKKQEARLDRKGYHFSMVGHEREVSIDCEPGFVSHLEAKGKANNCGIAKMLMQLCFNENQLHKIANKEENMAVAMLEDLTDEMGRWCKSNPNVCDEKLPGKVQEWANMRKK